MESHRPAAPTAFPVLALAFLAVIFLLNFIARIVFSPLLPILVKDLGLSLGSAGGLFLFISIGYAAGLLGSGFISARLQHRGTIAVSSLVLGLSLLVVAISSSLQAIIFSLLILGAAGGLYLPSGVATITNLAEKKHWGKAFAIHEMAPSLSLVLAPLFAEFMVGWASWRSVPAVLGVAALTAGVAFLKRGKGGEFRGEALAAGKIKLLARVPSFWIMVCMFSLAVSASLGIYAMMPLFLTAERGMDRTFVNQLLSVSRIPAVLLAFVGGWVSDRLGPQKTIGWIFFLMGIMTILLGLVPQAFILPFIFLQPMLAGCFFPAGFSALSRIGPPGLRNIIISLAVPFSIIIGAGLVPTGIGFFGEKGRFGLGIAAVGVLLLFILPLLRFLSLDTQSNT